MKSLSQLSKPELSKINYVVSELSKLGKEVIKDIKAEGERRGYAELVDRKYILLVSKKMKEIGFDHMKAITGIDFPDQEAIQVVYHFSSYSDLELAKIIFAVKTWVPYDDCKIDSIYNVFPSAYTFERETYEFLGVYFVSHPDMKLFFLPEDFEGVFPLRKSFKIKHEGMFIDREE